MIPVFSAGEILTRPSAGAHGAVTVPTPKSALPGIHLYLIKAFLGHKFHLEVLRNATLSVSLPWPLAEHAKRLAGQQSSHQPDCCQICRVFIANVYNAQLNDTLPNRPLLAFNPYLDRVKLGICQRADVYKCLYHGTHLLQFLPSAVGLLPKKGSCHVFIILPWLFFA